MESFYRRFIRNFSTIDATLTKFTNKGEFAYTHNANKAFEELKVSLCNAPALALPDFSTLFLVDASGLGIGIVLLQEKHHIAIFSEKLSGARLNYSTYDKELYATVLHSSIDLIIFVLTLLYSTRVMRV